jgi:hypothetical protein
VLETMQVSALFPAKTGRLPHAPWPEDQPQTDHTVPVVSLRPFQTA